MFASGLLSSKPYASSGKHIQRMGNHCPQCTFRVDQTIGPQAYPFNSLYWDFMSQHRVLLEDNPCAWVLYKSWDNRSLEA